MQCTLDTLDTGAKWRMSQLTKEYTSLSGGWKICVKEGEDMALLYLGDIWQNRIATFKANGNINIRNEMVNSPTFWGEVFSDRRKIPGERL